MPAAQADSVRHFQALAGKMKALRAAGRTIAVLGVTDTMFYLASGTRPWGRYSPLLPNLGTRTHLARVQSRLATHGPDYVFLYGTARRAKVFTAPLTWNALRTTIRQHYVLDSQVGPCEIWRRT